MNSLNALDIRRRLGREQWAAPVQFGPDGWRYPSKEYHGSIIVTVADWDGVEWVHASISYRNRMPEYADMVRLHHAVFHDGWAYEVFAPAEHHINIAEHARHLWGRLDKQPVLPNFGVFGSI